MKANTAHGDVISNLLIPPYSWTVMNYTHFLSRVMQAPHITIILKPFGYNVNYIRGEERQRSLIAGA